VSDLFDEDVLTRLCAGGADGFCLTSSNEVVLVKALELAMLGEVYFPAATVKSILNKRITATATEPPKQPAGLDPVKTGLLKEQLTSREVEILRFLTRGSKNKDIAASLNVSEATVKVHIQGILKKLGAANRTQAAMWATSAFSLEE